LDAVLICADRLHPWKHRIEAAFARLSAAVKGKARNKLFHFYASLPDWESAFEHRPRNPTTASDLLFSMWTFLELREMKLAKALVPKCKKALEVCQDEQDGSSLIEAVACYFAQAADWDKAVEMWEYGERAMPFAPNAWEGILKINALKAFLKANEVFQFVREDEPWEKLDVAFMARSGGSARLKADKLFHRYAKHLAKVVPAKERWRFGV